MIDWAFVLKGKLNEALDDVAKNGDPIPITRDDTIIYADDN